MENSKTTGTVGTGVAKKQERVIVTQKYLIKLNERQEGYHPLPKKERKNEGKISSQFISRNGVATRTIIRGLSNDQERYFAYLLINKTPKDQGYDEAMTTYWADYSVMIEGKLTLDASYELKEVTLDGEKVQMEVPLVLEEYIKAKFAMASSRVAFTEEEKMNRDLFDFIMEDLSVAEKNKQDLFRLRFESNKALTELISSCTESSHEKIDLLLEVLREPTELFYGLGYVDKCMKLTEKQENNPTKFMAALNDKYLEQKALLYKAVKTGVIAKEGEAYFFADTLVGSTEKEAMLFLADGTKGAFVAKIKAQLSTLLVQ